ncbi:OmpP1/FadL family transporter [Sphingobacterium rhinopitheci]|uniref:OmpP1/FadL family transporter n=1 Tax=Sphingobacterium rhinopitheci TaxID=2781960 RepID=UPI001F519A77|nr:outer membrane protein transport protein [Sphingobacterium rhinopitheci]MCI0920846.1 outer membrane protein transport protein [Sphingobacterium rhinopitheci]
MKKLLLLLLFASPMLLHAQGSQVNTQGIKALGISGAGSALFVDETSIFYNPGALAKIENNAISVGASAIMYRSAFREQNSFQQYNTKFQISPPFSIFATFGPKNTWWKAGIGVYTPFGGGVNWGQEWPGKFELNHLSLRAIYIQPTLSFKLTDNFSVGGGFVYNIGMVGLSRSIPTFNDQGQPGRAELSGTGTGTGYNVGIHYNLEDKFALSLSYRSKVVTKLKDGDAEFTVPSALASSFPTTTFDAELPLPSSFNVGITFPLSEKVDFVADGTLINYSIYKSLTFNYKHNTDDVIGDDALEDTYQPKNYGNAFSTKIGVNYTPSDKLELRAGGGYVITPVKPEFVYAETPDNNRIMASVGFTYALSNKFDINGAYTFQRILQRTVTNSITGLNGTFKTNIHAPGISLTYKW